MSVFASGSYRENPSYIVIQITDERIYIYLLILTILLKYNLYAIKFILLSI